MPATTAREPPSSRVVRSNHFGWALSQIRILLVLQEEGGGKIDFMKGQKTENMKGKAEHLPDVHPISCEPADLSGK